MFRVKHGIRKTRADKHKNESGIGALALIRPSAAGKQSSL
jgi:hypothetical protein